MILQGHLDMVCEKEPGCPKDLEREGLDLEADGDFVTARGTTLGGDDGIAVAMALALLDSRDLPPPPPGGGPHRGRGGGHAGGGRPGRVPPAGQDPHQPGLGGGGGVHRQLRRGQPDRVHPPRKAGALFGNCADRYGGRPDGGHSGTEIHRGRANANVPPGPLSAGGLRPDRAAPGGGGGGSKDNAIPTESRAQIVVSDEAAARAVLGEPGGRPAAGAPTTDPELFFRAEPSHWEGSPMDRRVRSGAVCLLTCLPNGVQAMSGDIPAWCRPP